MKRFKTDFAKPLLTVSLLLISILCLFGFQNALAIDSTTLHVGDTYTIKTDRTLGSDDFLTANWYSSNEDVLEIVGQNYNREDCQVRAVASSAGEIVTVYCEYQYALYDWPDVPGVYTGRLYYYFYVTADPPQSISLPETASITDASSVTLTPEISPAGAEASCTWSSSDTSVADVDQNGVVKGVSKGTAVITAETVNGLRASCTVTVTSSHACGDDLEWSFNNGLLTISGTGSMYDFEEAPWQEHSEEIREIAVSEGVTSVSGYAFAYTAAETVSLPESLVYIGEEAFSGCSELKSIYIPAGVMMIEGDAFASYGLKEINVSPENSCFSSFEGILFNKTGTTLVRYPQGREETEYAVPGFVKRIGYAAFYNTGLETLYVPDSVAAVEYYGISTMGLTVYGSYGSAAEKAVEEYNSTWDEPVIQFKDTAAFPPFLVSVGNAVGKYKDTVSLPVTLSGNSGFANLNIEVSYDPQNLRLVSAESEDFGALYTGGADMESGLYNMSWDSAADITYNGTIAVLEFEIIGESFCGRAPVGVSFWRGLAGDYVDGIDVNFDADFNDIGLWYMDGSIEVSPDTDAIIPGNIKKGNGLSFTAELLSENDINGTVIAAVYDENGLLVSAGIYDAAAAVDIELGESGRELAVMWFTDTNSLKPRCEAARVPLAG